MEQKFHSRAGSLVSFSNNGCTAQRNHPASEFNNGVIVSHHPLQDDHLFEVKIDKKVSSWSGSIEIGVTNQDPSNMTFPTSATGFREGTWVMSGSSVLKNGHSLIEDYGLDLDELSEGDRVGVLRTSDGCLHFYVNGADQGVAASDVTGKVYAVVDMYGKCSQVTLVESSPCVQEFSNDVQTGLLAVAGASAMAAEASFVEYSNERLTFHERCGSLIKLSPNRRTAERRRPLDEFNNGIVLTNRPLTDDEMFEIRLDLLVDKWSGSIEVGVTVHNPATLKFPATMTNIRTSRGHEKLGTIMMSGCGILTNGKGTKREYGQYNLDELTEGDRIGIMRKRNGSLHYYINGMDQGVASARTPPVVWGVIDLYGMAVRVTIVDSEEPGYQEETRRLEERMTSVFRVARHMRQEESHDDNQEVEKLLFHADGGQHTAVTNGGRTAYRPNALEDFNNGVALTQRLLRVNELFDVRIDKLVDKWAGSLEIGVTTHRPGEMDYPSTMTDVRSGTWMMTGSGVMHNGTTVIDRYGVNIDTLKVGDRVGVMRKNDGALHFFVNGVDQGEACGNIPGSVYGVVDLYGQAAQVTIMDTTAFSEDGASPVTELSLFAERTITSSQELCFHAHHGRNALLTNGARTAMRPNAREEFNDAVVMSNRPLNEGEMFEVAVEKLVDRWSGSVEAGVTTLRPDDLAGQFPCTMTDLDHGTWMLSGSGVMRDGATIRNGYACDLDCLQVGSRLGMMVWTDGSLHYYVDGRDMGAAYQNIPSGVYAVIELYGQCCQVSVTSGSRATTATLNDPDEPEVNVATEIVANDGAAMGTLPAVNLHRFSQCCGQYIALTNNNSSAKRVKHFCHGLVFSCDPVRVDELFQIRIDELIEHWSGSLHIGLTTMTVCDSTPSSNLPSAATDITNKQTWLVIGDQVQKNGFRLCDNYLPSLDRLQVGDTVAVCRRQDASMHVLINGVDMGPAAWNIPKNTFAVVDLYGKVSAVTLVSSSPTSSPQTLVSVSQTSSPQTRSVSLTQSLDDDEDTLDADWLQFNQIHAPCIRLTNQDRVAERTSGFDHGVVYGARPLLANQRFSFRVDTVDDSWTSEPLTFGLCQLPPPDGAVPATAMLLRHQAWLISGRGVYYNGLKVSCDYGGGLAVSVESGQVVSLMVDDDSNLVTYLDGSCLGVAASGLPHNCYPVIDMYGRYTKVTALLYDDTSIVTSSPVVSEQREKADCTKDRTQTPMGSTRICEYQKLCSRFKQWLGLPDGYFVPDYHQCFCDGCHRARGDDAYVKQGDPPKMYAAPFGWCQYNLRVPTKSGGCHDKWNVAYCGTHVAALRRILDCGQLLMSDDVEGSVILTGAHGAASKSRSKPDDDAEGKQITVSPTVTYAAHPRLVGAYTFHDDQSRKRSYSARVAFQVLVKPGSYRVGPQTLGANEAIDPRFCNSEIEWTTKERGATILSSLLLRLD